MMIKKNLFSIMLMAMLMSWTAVESVMAQLPFSKAKRQCVEYLVTADSPNRIYRVGEDAKVSVMAYTAGKGVSGVYVHYQLGNEMMGYQIVDSVMLINGMAEINMGTMQQPGFRVCNLQFTIGSSVIKEKVKVAYNPDKIEALTVMPKDFDRFWQRAIKEAAKVDLSPEIISLPQYSTDQVEVSLVKLNVGPNGRTIFGYLTKPTDGKRHPVMFCPPGAGSKKITPTTFYSERGYIYMNINIHSGCNPELSDSDYAEAVKVAKDYIHNGIESPETFYYRSVYAGCSRCVDFLCTLPEWDGTNVFVTGGSQGGALTLVTAALNKKVTACAPFYPALCDLTGFLNGRAGGWPRYFSLFDKEGQSLLAKEGNDNTIDIWVRTLGYYDVVNFARKVTCPVFYSFGYNDETCSPTSTYAAYNAITAPKTLDVTPTSGHWRFMESNSLSLEFFNQHTK